MKRKEKPKSQIHHILSGIFPFGLAVVSLSFLFAFGLILASLSSIEIKPKGFRVWVLLLMVVGLRGLGFRA